MDRQLQGQYLAALTIEVIVSAANNSRTDAACD